MLDFFDTWLNQGRILLESHNEICNECGGVCIFYLIQWNECARCCLRYVYTILELRSYQTWYINKLCNGGWKFLIQEKDIKILLKITQSKYQVFNLKNKFREQVAFVIRWILKVSLDSHKWRGDV